MLAFFRVLKKRIPDALFLILTQGPRGSVEAEARKCGLQLEDLTIHSVPFQKMPEWIAAGEAGIFFSDPSWANKARCPTKLSEFLALGIPVVASRGIGDVESIVLENRVGVLVEQFTIPAYERALTELLGLLGDRGLKGRCREAAERYFSLETGALKYAEVYEAMLKVRLGKRAV
jgi:glycosyltransferase involved in cell wall biosynthesis